MESNSHECGHTHSNSTRLNWLRAGVLGALDGIISLAAIILGITAGEANIKFLILATVSAIISGSLSMSFGEYLSVSSQRDSWLADIQKEIAEHNKGPEARRIELEELIVIYQDRGLSRDLSTIVATELSKKDPIRAHVRDELGIDMDNIVSPFQASLSSGIAFFLGSLLPSMTLFIQLDTLRTVSVVIVSEICFVIIALVSCRLGPRTGYVKTLIRLLFGGSVALGVTYGAGKLTTLV